MTWLALLFAFELGMIPQGSVAMYDIELEPHWSDLEELYFVGGSCYTLMEVEARLWENFFIGGGMTSYFMAGSPSSFPHMMDFSFNAGVRFDIIEIGWRHFCTHPVTPWLFVYAPRMKWESGYEEIYLRIEVGG